jgi:hypothetical protein
MVINVEIPIDIPIGTLKNMSKNKLPKRIITVKEILLSEL